MREALGRTGPWRRCWHEGVKDRWKDGILLREMDNERGEEYQTVLHSWEYSLRMDLRPHYRVGTVEECREKAVSNVGHCDCPTCGGIKDEG